MEDVISFYTKMGDECLGILKKSIERPAEISASHSKIFDFEPWSSILKAKFNTNIFDSALREFQFSIWCNNIGLYNLAFTGLRFFLERSLIVIMFSANEIELKLWEKGQRDTYWSEIIDENKGVFSNRFVSAFFEELKGEAPHFLRMAQKVYRECSEYVHGNLSTQSKISHSLAFNEDVFLEWHEKADIISNVVMFSLAVRYGKDLSIEEKRSVEAPLLDYFSHYPQIQALFAS